MSVKRDFTKASRQVGDGRQTVWVLECDCGFREEVVDSTAGGMPPPLICSKFEQRGWDVGKRPGQDTCRSCKLKAINEKATRRDELKKEAAIATVNEAPKPTAEPPRDPTREEKRRILESLEEHYLSDKGCYSKSFSDDAVSKRLNVPRAWVGRLRDEFYGPDVSEDSIREASERVTRLDGLEKRARDLEEKGMALASAGEALRAEVARMRAAIAS